MLLPSWPQWRELPKILSNHEKKLIIFFSVLIIISTVDLGYSFYVARTEFKPMPSGHYIEGALGQPKFINPIINETFLDRDLSSLIFSSLFKYNSDGKLVADLVEKFEIKNNGKEYWLTLRRDIIWHNQDKFNADDVIFTIETIKNSDYQSNLRPIFTGVTAEKKDDYLIVFLLDNSNYLFLNNLIFGIIPRILENIDPRSFALSEFNLKPIGTGPYQFDNFEKDKSGRIRTFTIKRFEKYYNPKPNLDYLTFNFYNNYDELKTVLESGEINGVARLENSDIEKFTFKDTTPYRFKIPKYFAIFFNQQNNLILGDKKFRMAINKAINKAELVKKTLNNEGEIMNFAIPNFILNKTSFNEFNLGESKKIFDQFGFKENSAGYLKLSKNTKEDSSIITLTILDNPEMRGLAELIKEQLKVVKINIKIIALPLNDFLVEIKSRRYQALLIPETLNLLPDLSSFWSSHFKNYPGLNLSLYTNRQVDKLLESIKTEANQEIRVKKYQQFADLIAIDMPAIFLYSPYYNFVVSDKIKGIKVNIANSSQDRFSNIFDWYTEVERVWK